MKKIILCCLLLSFNYDNQAQKIKTDTVRVEQSDRNCNKSKRRNTKQTGKRRTKFGKFIFDVLDVLEEIVPLFKNLTK